MIQYLFAEEEIIEECKKHDKECTNLGKRCKYYKKDIDCYEIQNILHERGEL